VIAAADIVNDPNWYLHAINLDEASLFFVKTDQRALSACSFLDHRFDIQGLPSVSIPLANLLGLSESIDSAVPTFVFHSAFCCSTLIARCLDLESANLSLKEPAVLMALANYQRIGHPLLANPTQAQAIYGLVTRLLFRKFGIGQTVLVKPTNTVNNIISPLMATHPQSKALLLHSDLESFLISILKKGEQGRGFARQLFTILLMDSPEARQLDSTRLLRMTDSQIVAITWHLQLEKFFDVFEKYGSSQVRSLHCDRLLEDPRSSITSLVDFFGFTALSENFNRLMDQAPLQSNAKTPDQKFDAENRSQEYAKARSEFSDTLEVIIPWAKQLGFKYNYSDKIANPL
jgi:hypothetical protein